MATSPRGSFGIPAPVAGSAARKNPSGASDSMWSSVVVMWALLPLLAAMNYEIIKRIEFLKKIEEILKKNPEVFKEVRNELRIQEMLTQCLKGKYHKTVPGYESTLYGQCLPWEKFSCCTEAFTKEIHNENPYNFNFDHCEGKNLSAECQKHFMQDHCFYECSPNVGPWLIADNTSWRQQRFFKVPLCASDCQAWFNSCANDYTCTDNWATKFDWNTSNNGNATNTCPVGSTCGTFKEKFGDAKTFCETVWNNSWTYSSDSELCMRLWFNGTNDNPNVKVASHYARLLVTPLSGGCSWADGQATLMLTVSWVVATQALVKILQCT